MVKSGEKSPTGAASRSLIHLPIIHTPADMGALRSVVQQLQVSKLGRRGWQRNVDLVDRLWARIERTIAGLSLPYARVRVYQDGLPECGREAEIVAELAKAGSRNHRLLLRLKDKGATLMGTESPDLLQQEYQLVIEALSSPDPKEIARREARQKAVRDSLLERRDLHIAARINSTLGQQETGILFLGALHSVAHLLDKDIRIIYPLDRPVSNRAGSR
jgi:hypothetical protein